MKKISISRDHREKHAEAWSRDFAMYAPLPPAERCAAVIRRVWPDIFGVHFHNGSFSTQLLPQRLKFLPVTVNQVLDRWQAGEIKLELKSYKPEPFEVLEHQSRGERIVSLLVSKQEILEFEEHGRDFLGFLIHDLIHASHFFTAESGEFQRQVVFSQWMKTLVLEGAWELIFSESSEVQAQFEYLVSDMNTHSWHLIKTLKSLVDQHQLKKFEIKVLQVLPQPLRELWWKINSTDENLELTHEFLENMLPKTAVRILTDEIQVCPSSPLSQL